MATILLIEDSVILRKLIRHMLEHMGHEVYEAPNGLEGVRRFVSNPCDLVITDIFMPEQEGLETIMILHKHAPTIGIIAISGGTARFGADQYLELAAKLGAQRILKKPFCPEQLEATLQELLTA